MLQSQTITNAAIGDCGRRLNLMGGDDETVEFRAEEADSMTTEYRELESKVPGCFGARKARRNRIHANRRPGLPRARKAGPWSKRLECRHYIESGVDRCAAGSGEATRIQRRSQPALLASGLNCRGRLLLSPEARAEMRAATVAPDTGGTNSRSILGRVFARSCRGLSRA